MGKESPLLSCSKDNNMALKAVMDLTSREDGSRLVYVSVLQVYHNELTDLLTQPSLKAVSAHKKMPYLAEQLYTDDKNPQK